MSKLLTIFFLFTCLFITYSQEASVWLHPNKGQWHENVLYQVDLSMGKMYVEPTGFTYHFYSNPRKDHDHSHTHEEASNDEIEHLHQHVVRSKFIGSTWKASKIESSPSNAYRNYYIGNDPSKWASKLHSYEEVQLSNFYPNIDLELNGTNGKLKYTFVVAPNADASAIQWKIDGADKTSIDKEGNLFISTSLGNIQESKPIAWTVKNGVKTEVSVQYKLQNNTVKFDFPASYQKNDTLIIDPYLVFSTYTGATSDNWGMTATPGPNGEMLAGGIVFGAGYPITTGAADGSFNGGTPNNNLSGFDVAISKFSSDGSQLLFSTFLGGNANELPESMITNTHGDLFVLGLPASPHFPMAGSPIQNSFAGGPTATHNALRFVGSDIFVCRVNPDGTQLDASTFIGGNDLDGLNISNLSFNYGDQYRGEIILQEENVIIASHTRSANFPSTNGTSLQGTQDAVVVKMTENLDQIIWSSFYGGSGDETGNSLTISNDGKIYIAGGTSSANFQFSGNDTSFGGDRDGYILLINGNNASISAGTYLGFAEYDQCYFVRTDIDNKVYVYGQTKTAWAITPGKYGNPNSGQFIQKYDALLTTIEWTTMIGASSGEPEISPTAFLISDCYDIFLSGWGGTVNVNGSQAQFSSSNNFPITGDAYQAGTNGSNFYLAILSQDAAALIYGTYIGGFSSSSNHVDGGTSRFDKSGAVYHAVCASCAGNDNGFVSTPGVWSETNNSPNCNLAAFKFQLGLPYSLSANSYVCNGSSVQLNATGGINYSWSPANSLNNPNIPNPIATPTETTVYYVNMDFNEGCAIVDSIIVEVISEPIIDLTNTESICLNDSISISASGGLTYEWSPNIAISSTNTSTVTVQPEESMYYYVTVGNECFERTDSIWIQVNPLPEIILTNDTLICAGNSAVLEPIGEMQPIWVPHSTLEALADGNASVTPIVEQYYFVTGIDANNCENRDSVFVSFYPLPDILVTPDTTICNETSIQLSAEGGISYSWSPTETLSNPFIANPIATPLDSTTYTVTSTYGLNCYTDNQVNVNLIYLPIPIVPDTIFACNNVETSITVGGAEFYSWSPGTFLNSTSGPTVLATVTEDITYTVTFTNVCGSVLDEVNVKAIFPFIEAFNDTIVCPGQSVQLFATGSLSYEWTPATGLNNTITSSVVAQPPYPTMYVVTGTDMYGCKKSDSVMVDLFPQPYIIASADQYLLEGDTAIINGETSSTGVVYWTPTEFLSCVMCNETEASPPSEMRYIVTVVDENGCTDSDDVWIFFDPLVYVPNTFSPQGDNINEVFKVIAGNISDFHWMIFNRWGELIYDSNDLAEGWDGTYKGKNCPDGTYTWKLKYNNLQGQEFKHVGHVNLLR